jgi:hypothetical protein
MNEILLYIGSSIIIIWGIAHIIATIPIVKGFGPISEDNKKIITMEAIAEGLTLCFLGALVLLVTIVGGYEDQVSRAVIWASAIMLLIMAILTAMTGARTPVLPYKICPVIKTVVAVLFILGIVL